MKAAIIAPTGLLKRYCNSGYHLALAHMLEDSQYLQFYRAKRDLGDYIILDNSVIELGHPVGPDHLIMACDLLQPSELVLADFPRDPVGTHFWAEKYAAGFKARYPDMKLMAVPQWSEFGAIHEWLTSYEELCAIPEVDVLGIPKFLKHHRAAIVHWLDRGRCFEKEHHLLGTWGNPIEILSYSHFSWIRGVDTKAPVRFGQHGIVFHAELGTMLPDEIRDVLPAMNFDYSEDPFPLIVHHNVKTFTGWTLHRELADVIYLDQPK